MRGPTEGSAIIAALVSVAKVPGAMALLVMPRPPNSAASARIMPVRPCLAAG